ncbi:MAG: Gfo/Idh/MocA family oxidoreductase [Verrucomicrobia bacterium]|nr:Gfo/Idh/MocA family oxidoreductase [Verrucomicrobiota bacterium]
MSKRIGLMGCGQVAVYGHIPAIQETPDLQLFAIFEPDPDRAREIQQRFGVPHAFSRTEDFFASGIEAVTITSPAPCHRENVLDCARHRLPALCEKPLAINKSEGDEMVAAMRSAGQPFHSGFCYRFSPVALKIRELVREGAIGRVRSLRLIYNWHLHGKYEISHDGSQILQRRREARMEEGGPMVDCGTHQIDLAHFWLGSPVTRFTAHGAWIDDYLAPDHMWLHLDHENGAHTVVEISYAYTHTAQNRRSEFIYELIGTGGIIRYDRDLESFFMENASGRHDFPCSPEKDFIGLYREWAAALHSGKSDLLATAEEGVHVADLARRATDEVMAGRVQPLS